MITRRLLRNSGGHIGRRKTSGVSSGGPFKTIREAFLYLRHLVWRLLLLLDGGWLWDQRLVLLVGGVQRLQNRAKVLQGAGKTQGKSLIYALSFQII